MKKVNIELTEKQIHLLLYALDTRIELDEANKEQGFFTRQDASDYRGLNQLKERLEIVAGYKVHSVA
jgi:hypothetical protein